MVNSGSFDAAGSEGESAKAEFTQLEDGDADAAPRSAASPRHLTDFAAVVPDTNQPSPSAESERDEGLTTPPQATMTTLNTTSCPPATPTKASLQCSVPLDKVKNVLEMCRQSQSQTQSQSPSPSPSTTPSPPDNSKFNNYFILENYLKQKQKTNELTVTPPTEKTDTESTTSSSNSGESSKPTLKRLLCLFCDRTFTSNNLKQKHVDRCHSAGQTRRSSSRTSSQNQSATACCFCSKLNQTEHTLKELFEHLINEHSNRYYACLSCQERFTSLQSLRDHNKIVHGIEDAPVSDSKSSSLSLVSSDTAASEVSDNAISADVVKRTKGDVAKSEAQTKSSPTASGKPLKRNSSLKSNENSETKGEQRESSKSVGFHVDFEDSILANIINPEDIKKSKDNEDSSDTITTRKSRSSASNSKNKQNPSTSSSSSSANQTSTKKTSNVSNKKISVKSTKNGVRNLRTTRSSVKQLNSFNKTRKSKAKSDIEPVQPEPKQKSMCNPASVFSLVNSYIYKYEKIYDHASDSIKDANSVQFNAVFDREFYLRTVCNIRENLLNHLDGKLNRNIESETRISHFEHNPALAEAKAAKDTGNFGCDLSLNAVTPVATLLASSQYGEDFDAQIEYGAKASQKKPKKIAVVKYKFPNKKYNSLFRERDGHTDLTCLDMWTQLTVKNRQSKVHDDGSFDCDSPFFDRSSGFEAKHLVDELNSILDKRGPFEDLLMEANAAQFLELRKKSNKDGDYISEEASKDVYFILDEILNRVVHETDVKIEAQQNQADTLDSVKEENLELPHYFQLQRSSNSNSIKIDKTDTIAQICSSKDENDKSDKRLELTGEWTRPRIYICAACGLKLPNLKSLGDHKNNDHPHIWCSHYEFVGNQSQYYRHLSIPGLGKVSVIESQPQNRVWQKSDARVCSKCLKQCHNLGELHKHILECGGDWTWMLARKKCKYRPYGARTRRRRQRGYKRTCNPEVSRARELKPKNKPNFIGPRPKPSKPSDAETIERMLANLPPKRNRKMISMRDGIQRPRKPYKQSPNSSSSHLNISQKPPSKHFKNNSPQITKQTLRSALKRKLAMNNLRKQKGNDNQENESLKLRSRMKNDERDEPKNKDTEPLSTKSKLRNKRMITRILGSKIFDSNTAIVTRRRLVKAITQNNLIRKTRLRTKMLEANALKLETQAQKEEPIVETEISTKVSVKSKEVSKENKRKEENSAKAAKSETTTKAAKPDKPNLENSTIDKTVKKSNSKRLLSVLTKSSKKTKVIVEDKPDTISAVINDVVNMAHREESTLAKSESLEKIVEGGKVGLRRTRSSNKLDVASSEETKTESIVKEDVIPAPETKTDKPIDNKSDNKELKKTDTFGKAFGKRTSKLLQNVKSFRNNMKQTNENKTDSKNESIASKLIRTFSIRGSKRKKTNKTDETDKSSVISFENVSTLSEEPPKDELKKTIIDDPPNITDETKETESPQILENTETSKTNESEMPILEKMNPLPEKQICDPIVLPVPPPSVEPEEESIPVQEKCDNETKTDAADVDNNETDFKQSDEILNATSGALNKFKSKMKRPGRGLNDCIAMLKCKLEQKTVDPPLVDKSNLFILNSLELNKHSLVSEGSPINTEESTKSILNEETPKNIEQSIPKVPILENTNSQDAIDLSMVSKVETPTLKNILEVPILKGNNKVNSVQRKEQFVEVSTVEIQTQTFEEDIAPALPEYLPHIQSNIQLSSLLNATLKNCLMECVKNKCEELRNDPQVVRKSSTKDRKIGSVRKRRTNKPKPSEAVVEKPPLNIPLLLNTAFTEKSLVKSKLGSTNSPRTTTAEDTSEDDLPLSKLVSSSSVESKLKVKLSVAKKKRSAKKQIAFTPLILNSPDTCIPQISFQERLEQRISLENPAPLKGEGTSIKEENKIRIEDSKKQIESNVPNYKEKNSPIEEMTVVKETIAAEANANCLSKEDLTRPIEENISPIEQFTSKSSIDPAVSELTVTSNQVETVDKSSNNQIETEDKSSNNQIETNPASTDHKETSVSSIETHPPLSEQVMLVEDEPLINYLVNKTLTETNVKPASSVKNAIPAENIELINKLDCIDSGKENSDIQGIKKQKKTVKKNRGKRKSRGKLNATDSQIDYSTSLEATEKIKTSVEHTIVTTNDDAKEESKSAELNDKVKDDSNETNLSISETKETDTLLEQPEKCNEDLKKKIKSPKKTADVASIIEAIEAAIQSSIKIQDEIDNKNKTNEETSADSSVVNQKKKRASRQKPEENNSKINNPSINNEESNLDDESNLASEESKEKLSEKIDNVVRRRRSRAKSKVNSESESVTPEEPTNAEENNEKIVAESLKVDEIPVVKKRRGRAKKVVEETNTENIPSLENLDKSLKPNEEQPEIKRTTRAKPKVNYVETDILDSELESMSEESNDQNRILDDSELKPDNSEITENVLQNGIHEDSEASVDKTDKSAILKETNNEAQVISEGTEKEKDESILPLTTAENNVNVEEPEAQLISEINTNEKGDIENVQITTNNEDIVTKIEDVKKTVNQSKLETEVVEKIESEVTNNVEKTEDIPGKVKSKRGRKPKNKNKIHKIELEPVVTSIIDEKILETGENTNNLEPNKASTEELNVQPCSEITESTIEDGMLESNSVVQQILKETSNTNIIAENQLLLDDIDKDIENIEKRRRSRGKPKLIKEQDAAEFKTDTNIVEEEKSLIVETPIEVVQNETKIRRSCMKIKLNYQEADEVESDESSNTGLDAVNEETSLEETKVKQRSLSMKSSTTSEPEEIPELNASSEIVPVGNKDESFLHPEEIKPRRKSRTKLVSPISEIQTSKFSNLELMSSMSSDDSSNTLEETKPKRRSRTRKMLPKQGTDVESNSDLDMASSINSNESFINPDETKVKRRFRGKMATNQEMDNESISSLNSDESSTNLEEIKLKRHPYSSLIAYDQEPDIPESKSVMETAFSIFDTESSTNLTETKTRRKSKTNIFANQEPENIESNTEDSETVSSSSNELNASVEDKKIKRRSRKKHSIDNIVSRLTETVKHDESSTNSELPAIKQNSQSKITIKIPFKNVQSNLESGIVPEVNSEDTIEKQQPRLKITIANQKIENVNLDQTNSDVDSVHLYSKPKRKSRSKTTVDNQKIDDVEQNADSDMLPKENNFNFNLNFESIKNKLKSRLEETENVEPNISLEDTSLLTENISTTPDNSKNKRKSRSKISSSDSTSDVSNSVSESVDNEDAKGNQIERTPKFKITLVNPEPENVEAASITNSIENTPELTENKQKKKRRSFIKIKLNLPPEPDIDDIQIPEVTENIVEPEITAVAVNESIGSVEIKKKKRYRKKELELLGASTIENHLPEYRTQITEASNGTLSDNIQSIEKPESMVNKDINEEKIIDNTNVEIENISKLSEEIPITKPEPKKRGRKPKNAKNNATLDSLNPPVPIEISVLNLDTTDLQQLDLETENKDLVNTDTQQPLESVEIPTELEESNIESDRKSRRSRPKINYQEIENDESTDLSSDSELSIIENTQDECISITNEIPEEGTKSNSLEELDNVEKEDNFDSEMRTSVLENDDSGKDSSITVEQQHEDDQIQNTSSCIPVSDSTDEIVNETKPKKKRGRKKASVIVEENKIEKDIDSVEPQQLEQHEEIQIAANLQTVVVTPKPRGRGRPSTKQKQETQNPVSVVENVISTPDLDEIDVVARTVNEISEEFKRKSRSKINYQELENSTSIDSISDMEVKISEEIDLQPVTVNTEEIVTPHIPKKRGRKPKRKNINRQESQVAVISEPVVENHVLPENVVTAEEPIIEKIEYNKKRSRSNSVADDVVPQITELKKAQEEQLPILKIDMKKRRQQTLENQFETETNLEEFNETENATPVSCDEAPVHKIKKKRRSRSKNSETMSQQNIASAIELLTNVENTIESLKEFTKDKPLTNNFKNQLQENIEYEPETIMECKTIQDLTSAPSLNVTVAISPATIASDSEDELPLSILVKSKPDADTEGINDIIPEINAVVNESSLISENSLLDINVDEISFTKAENKLILSTHNSFDFDDDNIIDQEELSQLVDITSESLLENIEDDYISTIDTAAVAAKEIVADKILDEIKQVSNAADETYLDEIIEDLDIVAKCIPLKTDSNIVPPESLDDTLATIDKSAEELLNLIDVEEESDFIKTPDLKDTSLIIKIKKNFNVHIRKAKKGRRRVIPKSLNRNNIRRREEEDAVCDICNKSFKRKETLASHKKTLTHIAKLSEIEARENQAKRLSESEHAAEDNKEERNEIEEEDVEASKEIPEIERSEEMPEILNADESSCENVDLTDGDEAEKTDVPEIVNVAPQKPMNNILPGLIVNSTNSTLKLIDIINEVLDKPVSDLNMDNKGYSPQSIRKSPTSCDSTETFSEPKRYKSLGERKSFDSDSYTMTPKSSNEDARPEHFNTTTTSIMPITNGEILCKQLSILENIIEETSPSLNTYIDDSVSLSSSQFEEPLPEPIISDKDIDYTKFSHTADVLSTLIKPNHFNNFENISESFTKPIKHQGPPEQHSHQHQDEEEVKNSEVKDNSTRKILNRDEELFLECCSLLKSGSEISGSKKSTKQIQLNNFSRSNDASWIKQQNSDRFIQRDSYSWLAQSSRVETPIGEPFVNNDWSNSNSAVSSEWLAQKAPSPDRPTESNTILKKSNNNSEESKYTDLRFEDISIDSSLETSKTLMAVEHSNTENIPLDFHNVDFANSNLQQQTPKHQNEEVTSNHEEDGGEEEEVAPIQEKQKPIEQSEDTSSRDEFDPELKKKVVSAFGGLMAKALGNRLHAVVRKTKKSKGKRDQEGTIQSSITDYVIPVKKNKPNQQTDSDSSDCPKKLITKGAMKVFEGIKVSIPTHDLNLKDVLNKTKKPEVEANAEKLEEKEFEAVKEKEVSLNKNGKVKHLFGRFGNKLGLREKKKKTVKRRSPKSQNVIPKSVDDVYEFEESLDKSTFSLFKHAKESNEEQTTTMASKNGIAENEAEKWNAESESDTDRYYDSMSFEEQSLSSESTPESTTPVKMKPIVKKATEKSKDNQKKCMIMGRIFKNASKPKLEDKIPEIRDFTSEENSKVVGNNVDSCSSGENVQNGTVEQPPEVPNVPNNSAAVAANSATNKMSKKEMDMLFDKLLEEEMKMHEKEILRMEESNAAEQVQNEDVFSKPLAIDKTLVEKKKPKDSNRVKVVGKPKKRQRHNSDSTSSDEFRLGGRQSKSTKRPKTHRKPTKPKKESGFNLEQEMKECIGVAGRKSQRKCTSGKQNVLVESWSSDESSFEDVLSLIETQNESKPIAAIEEHSNEEEEEEAEEEEEVIDEINDVSSLNNSVNNSIDSKEEICKKPTLDIYDFESDAESKIEDFHPKPTKPEDAANQQLEDSEFLAVNKMKIPKRIPKPKRSRKHSRNHDEESASEYEAEKTRRKNEHRRKKMLENEGGESAGVGEDDCLAVSRRKRNAGDQLYYWSSSSDDEMQDLIEVKPIREDTDDDRPMHHGWIVGDSPKKLVTMLAQAKGKKIDGESVKEQGKKNRVTL